MERKILDLPKLLKKLSALRKNNKSVATLNGSFDLLHAGHLWIFREASRQADILVAALNTDASVRSYKGRFRPIISLKYRLQMVAALEMVDFVTWFDEKDPRVLLEKIRPDVHVNGAEYGENCIEAETVRACGGRICFVPRIDGLSTSQIIKKIKTCE